MFNPIKTTALSVMLGLGALAALPAAAQADGLYLNFGDRGGPRVGVYEGDSGRVDYRRDRGRYDDDRRFQRGCSPERALDKADRLGLRRARVVEVDRRTITVSGRKFGDRVRVTFARAPGCPIVGY